MIALRLAILAALPVWIVAFQGGDPVDPVRGFVAYWESLGPYALLLAGVYALVSGRVRLKREVDAMEERHKREIEAALEREREWKEIAQALGVAASAATNVAERAYHGGEPEQEPERPTRNTGRKDLRRQT